MESHSPYIKKYLKKIEAAGYTVNKDGSQLHKYIGRYEVLVTDLTVKSLFMIKTVLVWIKNTETKTIEKEKFFRHEILPLPFSKIDDYANASVAELSQTSKPVKVSRDTFLVKDLVHDTSNLNTHSAKKVTDVSIHDLSV